MNYSLSPVSSFNSAAFIFFLSGERYSNIAAIKSQVCLLCANTGLKKIKNLKCFIFQDIHQTSS